MSDHLGSNTNSVNYWWLSAIEIALSHTRSPLAQIFNVRGVLWGESNDLHTTVEPLIMINIIIIIALSYGSKNTCKLLLPAYLRGMIGFDKTAEYEAQEMRICCGLNLEPCSLY